MLHEGPTLKGIFSDYVGHNLNVRGVRSSRNNTLALSKTIAFPTGGPQRIWHFFVVMKTLDDFFVPKMLLDCIVISPAQC
jgi:hypothetical protein